MQNEPLNTSSIQQFISQVKSADSSNAREVKLTMPQAKNLAYTLGIVMARLQGDLERYVKENATSDIVEVQLDGGTDWK
jgi:Tfp pilus assembly PilM family ATPase